MILILKSLYRLIVTGRTRPPIAKPYPVFAPI
jgi:hypothetical protein